MARRGREAALKRSREKARQEKKEAKREKRSERRTEAEDSPEVDEQSLMEEFARLSERHEAGEVNATDYDAERARILGELGIEEPQG